MLNSRRNYLLNKDDVGKPKPCVRDLPPNTYTFGKPNVQDSHSAKQLQYEAAYNVRQLRSQALNSLGGSGKPARPLTSR